MLKNVVLVARIFVDTAENETRRAFGVEWSSLVIVRAPVSWFGAGRMSITHTVGNLGCNLIISGEVPKRLEVLALNRFTVEIKGYCR